MASLKRSIPSRRNWVLGIFNADSVRNGGVVRRDVDNVRQFGSIAFLKSEVRRREFHLIRTGDQYVILCHKGDIRILI